MICSVKMAVQWRHYELDIGKNAALEPASDGMNSHRDDTPLGILGRPTFEDGPQVLHELKLTPVHDVSTSFLKCASECGALGDRRSWLQPSHCDLSQWRSTHQSWTIYAPVHAKKDRRYMQKPALLIGSIDIHVDRAANHHLLKHEHKSASGAWSDNSR
jgi:hypothetical protein